MFGFFKKQTDPRVLALYDRAVRAARTPTFYQNFGVADTLDGRFDMVVLHISPLIDGLRGEDGALTEEGQALFDTFVRDMEQNLRTLGASDTTFPKKMKKIGQAFYGRFNAYRSALADEAALATAIARNVLDDEARGESEEARALARYLAAAYAGARETGTKVLEDFAFPDPSAFAPGGADTGTADAPGKAEASGAHREGAA